MKKLIAITSLSFLLTQSVFAALPPLAQSVAELNKILEHPQLQVLLAQAHPILKIEHVENGYLITTSKTEILAEVVYTPSSQPGPQQFSIKFKK